jgi:hypothetical protein
VDETGSASCPMVDLGIIGVETSGSIDPLIKKLIWTRSWFVPTNDGF